MRPLFFGKAERQLFGAYHAPSAVNALAHGVLLCYPGIHEYNGSHWAFRRLADMLTRSGFHVFRFDYFGTGDSMGRSEEGHPDAWIRDIRQAANELSDLADVPVLSIIGMRLGASLAYLACRDGLSVENLILWEPIISGYEYLRAVEHEDARRSLLLLHWSRTHGRRHELVGYRCAPDVRAAIEAIDLRTAAKPDARRIHAFVSGESNGFQGLREGLNAAGAAVSVRRINQDFRVFLRTEGSMLGNDVLVAMTEALGQNPPPEAPGATVLGQNAKSSSHRKLDGEGAES